VRTVAALALGVLCLPPAAHTQVHSRWRPDERTVIGDHSTVLALAAGEDRLYVFTETGVGLYDVRLGRWDLPRPMPPGLFVPPGSPALVDPMDRSVWIGAAPGLVHYDPRLEMTEAVQIPGGAVDLMFDLDDTFGGLYVRSRTGWFLVERGSGIARPVTQLPPVSRQIRATNLAAFLQREPGLVARAPLLLTDDRLRSYRYTAAAELWRTEDQFVGTDGFGVLWVDGMSRQVQRLPFGLLDAGVWGVAVIGGRVIAGTSGDGARWGFTELSPDLQRFGYLEGPPSTGYRFRRVYAIAEDPDGMLVGTDRGAWRVRFDGDATRVGVGAVTDATPVYAVARTSDGAWLGTDRGLVRVEPDGTGMIVDERVRDPVYALLSASDTLWIGAMRGVAFVPPGGADLFVPGDLLEDPWMRAPVVALGRADDALVAATEERIAWRDSAGQWRVERSLAGEVGRITSMATAPGGVWIGGATGIVFFRPGRAAFPLSVPGDELPGPVRDLASDGRYLWVSTSNGLVRFDQAVLAR
jgi:ligand-binding sensor domain-containing protein